MKDGLELMRERQSDRVAFDETRRVPERDLRLILEAARWAPTAHNMQNFEVVVVDDRIIMSAIQGITLPISREFLRENREQLSASEEELKERKVGLLASMFPPFMREPDAEVPAGGRPFLPAALLLVVLYDPRKRAPASEGDFLGIMSLGCVMQNMWLAAREAGLGFHIVSSLSSPPAEKEIKRILEIPAPLKIAFTCRVGYPKLPGGRYLRVRRAIEDFTHRNRFGSMLA